MHDAKDMENSEASARALALRRLGQREYAALEMKTYLVKKGIDVQEAADLVATLVGEHLIDDLRYARMAWLVIAAARTSPLG